MAGDGHAGMVLAVVLIDDDQIRHFHQAFFDALQIVATAGDLQ